MRILTTFALILASFFAANAASQHEVHDNHSSSHEEKKFNPVEMIMHHIADSHDWHLWDLKDENGVEHPVSIPLPIIVLHEGQLDIFMSSEFDHGHKVVQKGDKYYALYHDHVYLTDEQGTIEKSEEGKVENASPIDLSITRNVVSMFISIALLLLLFVSAAKSYAKTGGVPRGLTGFLEPLVLFVRDDIARPNIGEKNYEKYLPYLLTVFFFIWINNLLGLIPIFPGASNLTGNIAFTAVLSVFTLIITNVSANKYYWKHIFMPPVPIPMYIIMIPVEIIGIFTKPFALMVRLFANITAGHILILSLVSLIFIFKSMAMSAVAIPFMVFMNVLELLVAALQAYIFTLLSSLFIGMAIEDHH